MPRPSNHLRYLSAAGVLALGTACAANVYLKPPSYRGPDPVQLRQLADRVSAAPSLQSPPLDLPPARHSRVNASAQGRTRPQPSPAVHTPDTSSKPAEAAPPAETKPAPATVIKQIALTGVTQQGDAPTAWLMDISTHERETATPGASAFGFVVKEIGTESVLLAQDGEEFTVWMGDKEIPVVEPETPPANPVTAQNGNDGGQGRWGRRAFAGFNRGGGWSGRSGGGNWSGGWGGNRNWGGNRSSGNNFSGGFRGSFGGFGGQGFNQGNNRNTSLLRPTANPQEARRRGVRLIGGANPLPTPSAIRNPQTSRRRGTNSGRAFGSDPNWR
jgi:hypothetical protein